MARGSGKTDPTRPPPGKWSGRMGRDPITGSGNTRGAESTSTQGDWSASQVRTPGAGANASKSIVGGSGEGTSHADFAGAVRSPGAGGKSSGKPPFAK